MKLESMKSNTGLQLDYSGCNILQKRQFQFSTVYVIPESVGSLYLLSEYVPACNDLRPPISTLLFAEFYMIILGFQIINGLNVFLARRHNWNKLTKARGIWRRFVTSITLCNTRSRLQHLPGAWACYLHILYLCYSYLHGSVQHLTRLVTKKT